MRISLLVVDVISFTLEDEGYFQDQSLFSLAVDLDRLAHETS